jgi:hypothetical protein
LLFGDPDDPAGLHRLPIDDFGRKRLPYFYPILTIKTANSTAKLGFASVGAPRDTGDMTALGIEIQPFTDVRGRLPLAAVLGIDAAGALFYD